ncbi:MAG TPA: sugar kinase [Saprospiraceae bacterium]|nr:sugar kinase [Saprospiraceae bacterium]
MKEVLCLGECLLRLIPELEMKWLRFNQMKVYVAGSELNVAYALTKWGIPVRFFTAFPPNHLTLEILDHMTEAGINTSHIIQKTGRLGVYYLAEKKDVKDNSIIYDRAGSSFSLLLIDEVDWDALFGGVQWLHLSAINLALGPFSVELCHKAVEEGKKRNIKISIDLNYRSALWKDKDSPVSIMREVVSYCDVIMGNIWSANHLLNIPLLPESVNTYHFNNAADHSLIQILNQFPDCKSVAFTFRFDAKPSGVDYSAFYYYQGNVAVSDPLHLSEVIDKVGSGDCFMAALIYSQLSGLSPEETINLAARAAVAKLAEAGDHTNRSIDEINDFFTE